MHCYLRPRVPIQATRKYGNDQLRREKYTDDRRLWNASELYIQEPTSKLGRLLASFLAS